MVIARNNILIGLLAACVFTFSCDLEDRKAKRMYSHSGIWDITSITTEEFDSAGHVVNTETLTAPAKLIFFQTESMMIDHYKGIFIAHNDSTAATAHHLDYLVDHKRLLLNFIEDAPFDLSEVYTIENFGRREQQWHSVTYSERNGFSMTSKTTIRAEHSGF